MSLHISTNKPGCQQETFDFNTAHAILFEVFLTMNKKEVKLTDQFDLKFWIDFGMYINDNKNEIRIWRMGFNTQGEKFMNWMIGLGRQDNFIYQFGFPFMRPDPDAIYQTGIGYTNK